MGGCVVHKEIYLSVLLLHKHALDLSADPCSAQEEL